MIGRLKGRVEMVADEGVILDVGGVGYVVHCGVRTRAGLPPVGEACALWIETIVREDAFQLYGFLTLEEQAWFRLLMTVQGVAAKMALTVLAGLTPTQLLTAIASGDTAALSRAKGVGPKLAARMVTELKDKAPMVSAKVVAMGGSAGTGFVAANEGGRPVPEEISGTKRKAAKPNPEMDAGRAEAVMIEEAVSALVHLGYGRSEAFEAVARVRGELSKGAGLEAIVPRALRLLSGERVGV